MFRYVDIRDLLAGILVVLIGIFVASYAMSHYEMGSLEAIGPGFLPALFGWILIFLGGVIALFSVQIAPHSIPRIYFPFRAFLSVIIAIALFGLLIDRIGLIPTSLMSIVVSSYANSRFQFHNALILGMILAVMSWLIFTVGLDLPIQPFIFSR